MQNRFENSAGDNVINGIQTNGIDFYQDFIGSGGRVIYIFKSQLRLLPVAFKRKGSHRPGFHLVFIL